MAINRGAKARVAGATSGHVVNRSPEAVKVEGTTRTYGQDISVPPASTTASPSPPTSAQVAESNPTAISITGLSSGHESQVVGIRTELLDPTPPVIPMPDIVSSPGSMDPALPPPIADLPPLILANPAVMPIDTRVNIVQRTNDLVEAVNEFGTITAFPCKAQSSVALAAASAHDNATAVVPKLSLMDAPPITLTTSLLNSFSAVIPNVEQTAIVHGSSIKSKEEIKEALSEAQKVDLTITLKSKTSETIEFNTIKTPKLVAGYIYNYFVEDEEDIEAQEDQARDPLLTRRPIDTPRYVELRWSPTSVTEPVQGTLQEAKKNSKLRRDTFSRQRGNFTSTSSRFRHSVANDKKRFSPTVRNGVEQTIVDVHQPEKAFENIGNDKAFANSICVVLNTRTQEDQLSSIPYESIDGKNKDGTPSHQQPAPTDSQTNIPGVPPVPNLGNLGNLGGFGGINF